MHACAAVHAAHGSRQLGRVLALLAFCAEAALAAEQTRVVGGSGGTPFVDRPAPGVRVGAVAITAGSWIDSVAVVYEAPDGRRYPSMRHGGPGGGPCVIALQPDERILAIRGRYGNYIDSIQLITTKGESRVCGGAGGGSAYRIEVPPNHTVVGFAGRAGQYLDAIGLALAPANANTGSPPGAPPAPAPAPAPAPPTASKPPTLVGAVNVSTQLHQATLRFRLSAPSAVRVSLGTRPLDRGECFGANERDVVNSDRPSATDHAVTFSGLQMAMPYSYAVRIGASTRCESGRFTSRTSH